MKASKMVIGTLREVPAEAEIPSHQLMLRAGLMRKLVAGVYTYLPLGHRVLRKVEQIVREEMDRAGAQEILASAVQPKELWEESGRWNDYGPEMFRLKDRHGREFCLGPTHEEIFTALVRAEIKSYKQLPVNLYQIQNKYRDERRPRFGLMRSREFLMKDAYSFDVNEEGLEKNYQAMYDAYAAVFDRCEIKWKTVLADTGAIGGTGSHQFMALSDVGEGLMAYCTQCDYAADEEKAEAIPTEYNTHGEMKELEKVSTPGVKTIENLTGFFGVAPQNFVKTLLYKAADTVVAVLVRGDREVNPIKLCNLLGVIEENLVLADEEIVKQTLNTEIGFVGPMGLNVPLYVDKEVVQLKNFYVGANEKDYHFKNVNFERDFIGTVADLRNVVEGDACPTCGTPMKMERGIEVGQIFKLGTKYSTPMGCTVLDENGKEIPMVMGCYGIGVSRTVASIIEQHHDENGIIWPLSVAPYHVVVVPVNVKNAEQSQLAEEIYTSLKAKGMEVILDDRDERVGVKFKDWDLIGVPVRITVGKRAAENVVEFKLRTQQDKTELTVEEMYTTVQSVMKNI